MTSNRNVLIVIAHPDDEVFASATLCLCADQRFEITLVCVTSGEGASAAFLESPSPARVAEVRRREVGLSALVLGVREVLFLEQPDVAAPDAPGAGAWDQALVVERLAAMIRRLDPELVLTHGPRGGYGHPAHRLTHRCVMAAAQDAGLSGSVFSFCGKVPGAFFTWHFDEPSAVLVDARSFLRRREASLGYHQSQIDYFVQPPFPRTLRKRLSALFGLAFSWTEAGRKRAPIGTAHRFFLRFPTEGLAVHRTPAQHPHFFAAHFADDRRVRIVG